MRGGFRRLIYPGTPVDQIDAEGTREDRARINELIRKRQWQLDALLRAELPSAWRPDQSE